MIILLNEFFNFNKQIDEYKMMRCIHTGESKNVFIGHRFLKVGSVLKDRNSNFHESFSLKKDHYETLMISRNSSRQEIKQAYYKQ